LKKEASALGFARGANKKVRNKFSLISFEETCQGEREISLKVVYLGGNHNWIF